jgi:serine/threonine protein kinase
MKALPFTSLIRSLTRWVISTAMESRTGLNSSYALLVFYFSRDLKPENLLCNEDASVIKIADFGLSKDFGASVCHFLVF